MLERRQVIGNIILLSPELLQAYDNSSSYKRMHINTGGENQGIIDKKRKEGNEY